MSEPFLALVTPLVGGQPPGIWGGAGQPFPTPPMAPGGPPPGVWPGGTPEHPIAPGSPGSPTHPIAPGGPGVGGGPIIPPPPHVDADLLILVWVRGHGFHWIAVDKDLVPEHPIELPPPAPTHPIAPPPAPTPEPKK